MAIVKLMCIELFEILKSLTIQAAPCKTTKDGRVICGCLAEYEVYIKLTAYLKADDVQAVCVSFHEAEWPLVYPYRKAS